MKLLYLQVLKKTLNNNGVTLIELLAALALISLVLGAGYSMINQGFLLKNNIETVSKERFDLRVINVTIQDLIYKSNKISIDEKEGQCGYVLTTSEKEYFLPLIGTDTMVVKELSGNSLTPFLSIDGINEFSWKPLLDCTSETNGTEINEDLILDLTILLDNNIEETLTFFRRGSETRETNPKIIFPKTPMPEFYVHPKHGDTVVIIKNNDVDNDVLVKYTNKTTGETHEVLIDKGSNLSVNLNQPLNEKDILEISAISTSNNKLKSDINTYTVPSLDQTMSPTIYPLPQIGENKVFVRNEENGPVTITLTIVNTSYIQTLSFENHQQVKEFNVPTLLAGQIIEVTAKAPDKLLSSPTTYTLPQSSCLINPNGAVYDISGSGDKLIFGEEAMKPNAPSYTNPLVITDIKTAIGIIKTSLISSYEQYRNAVLANPNAQTCSDCTVLKIKNIINNDNTNNPIIIIANDLSIGGEVVVLGSTEKKVILVTNHLNTDNSNLKIYGDLIVRGNMSTTNQFTIDEVTNLYVFGNFTTGTQTTLTVKNTLYKGNFYARNNITINTKDLIIKNNFELDTQSDINVSHMFITGDLDLKNNVDININSGDLLIENSFESHTKANLNVSGYIAVGSDFDYKNHLYINNPGVRKTSINLNGSISGCN